MRRLFHLPAEQGFSTLQHITVTRGNSDLLDLGQVPVLAEFEKFPG